VLTLMRCLLSQRELGLVEGVSRSLRRRKAIHMNSIAGQRESVPLTSCAGSFSRGKAFPASSVRRVCSALSTTLSTTLTMAASTLVAHGIKRLGVLGAGQMGTGIAMVSALRAGVPVLLYDRSPEQVKKGLGLMDKLLEKDVAKGRLTSEQAKEARDRVEVVGTEAGLKGLRDVDMAIEVCNPCRIFSAAF